MAGPPAALVAGILVLVLGIGFAWIFGPWPGPRPARALPRVAAVTVTAAHLLVGGALIGYAVEPARWLRTGLVVLVVPVTFGMLLSVIAIGLNQEASRAGGHDQRRRFSWLLAAAISWLLLGFAVAPAGSYRPPDASDQIPSWLRWASWLGKLEDLYQAGFTILFIVVTGWIIVESFLRRKWADASEGLGCLAIIAIIAFAVFLIGGWALVGQIRITRD